MSIAKIKIQKSWPNCQKYDFDDFFPLNISIFSVKKQICVWDFQKPYVLCNVQNLPVKNIDLVDDQEKDHVVYFIIFLNTYPHC